MVKRTAISFVAFTVQMKMSLFFERSLVIYCPALMAMIVGS